MAFPDSHLHLSSLLQLIICSALFIAALAYLAFSQIALPAILIDLFSAQANDRFENDPAFVLNGANLSGVALTSNGRWVTMLSSNVFVTADHYAPTIGSSVKFYGSRYQRDGYL